ncbi:MAG: TIGR00282 family metallophosphoesterase [bacterium]
MPFFRILFIGDIIGSPGRSAVKKALPEMKKIYNPNLIIANGENLAGGLGITPDTAKEVIDSGVDLLTTGNHVWDKKEIIEFIDMDERILRPANYPKGTPGKGFTITIKTFFQQEIPIAVFNLSGRVFMEPLDNPFTVSYELLPLLQERSKIIILDFHAEATSEKIAMGRYLDGKVSAVIGTHTHVQTADETIFPGGTAYITDVGMTGPIDSVIGTKKDLVIKKFITQMPVKFDVPDGNVLLCAVIVDIDPNTGYAVNIERISKVIT